MRKFILAAAALAALSAAPAFAMEGTFEPTVTASGFGTARGPVAGVGGSFQYNNAGNYGDTGMPAAGRPSSLLGGRISSGSFTYNMASGQG
jgi:hypothetical protein